MHNNDTLGCNIANRRGQGTWNLEKCDDEDYDNADGKLFFGDYDDDDEDNDDHHDAEILLMSCFGSAWQLFQKYQFLSRDDQ